MHSLSCRFTSDQKESFAGVSGVTITTYTMVSYSGRRSEESARVMDEISSREWGLLLLDEVHVVPAQMFRKVRWPCHEKEKKTTDNPHLSSHHSIESMTRSSPILSVHSNSNPA